MEDLVARGAALREKQYPPTYDLVERLFAYGTINDQECQMMLWNDIKTGKPAVVAGYRKFGENIPWIDPDTESEVSGRIYELNHHELMRCDQYEGPSYMRVRAIAEDGTKVWVYARNRLGYDDRD